MSASGGVKHAKKAPAMDRAATLTGFRPESGLREADDKSEIGE